MILNASYEPLSVVTAKRGLILVLEGKAVMTEQHPDRVVRSATKKFPLPTQIKLNEFIKSRPAFRVPAQLTQRNLFVRDSYTCQYCGRRKHELGVKEYLTRDHVVPTTRGGKDVWNNVVTACVKCNNIKADLLLNEMEDLYYKQLKLAEFGQTDKLRKDAEELADWIANHLVDVSLSLTSPTILEIWSKSELKIPQKQKKKKRK